MDAFGSRPRVSANSFANGSNQNCGNVLSDIPTTRVAAPPGGKSSICLGWDDRPPAGGAGRQAPIRESRDPAGYQAAGARRAPDDDQAFGSRPRESGNSFANGHNQNTGNVLTGVPSTRVSRPPGGQSEMSLAWDTSSRAQDRGGFSAAGARRAPNDDQAFGSRPRESGNSFANGHNQNTGNVLTGVPSTRVSRPPGGQSEMSLAWDTSSRAQAPAGRAAGRQDDQAFGRRVRESSNSYANGADQNCGNVLSDTPTTRVLRPPGGGGTLSLGWA
ncbi:unnamed protein product [Effrenium voratum]|nr:unnamed protein product [Effrenium voratum]